MVPSNVPPPLSVTVHAARVTHGSEILFDGLDITLAAGRWTCLLGPSGVGKSTLLRLILGLETPERRAGGGDTVTCSDESPLTGRAAFMAQTDLLLPWLTALANVDLGRRLRGTGDGAMGEARALLERVGLAANAGDQPATLSGGMRQRVALARTLMEDRPVVLMDEPFSALDAITRIKLQNLAAELLRDRTVLLVTHDPLEALRLGHRIHVMAGRPALVDEALEPAGPPPRDVDDPMLLEMQGDLLRRLAEATS
ncbi:MAG: ABC transporter ATP-binding protein [Rhodospirillales bacterium]|jgi:putative hydroxymethylpyrimidine transport system ATP-binding protein|nr:ABC transporter ATP-binding protein [Rhodospirillales bacterium]